MNLQSNLKSSRSTASIVAEFKEAGFVNPGSIVFTPEEANELATLCDDLYTKTPKNHEDFLKAEEGAGGIRGVPRHSPRIAALINKILETSKVKEILYAIVGDEYKLWQINLRRSNHGDPGLEIHQDSPGQINISVLLSDNADGDGATLLVKGSHRVSQRIADLRAKLPPSVIRWTRPFFSALTGKRGDIAFMSNRCWHGRFPNQSGASRDVLMIGIFPPTSILEFDPPYNDWDESFLKSIAGTEMAKRLDLSTGVEALGAKRYRVTSTHKNAENLPYSVRIETEAGKVSFSLKLKIGFMRLLMHTGRPLARAYRRLAGSTT